MTNRQLAALETKKKLLHAAKEVICEKGLANVSVAEITKKCGVANGTFYTYFKRKEDIVFALSREMYQEVLDKALEYPGTFMERLSFFMTSFTDRIEKSGLKLCQEWVRNTVDPDLVENEDDRSKLTFDIHSLTVLLEDGIERGELASDAPVSILAYTLADILYGEVHLAVGIFKNPEINQFIGKIIGLFGFVAFLYAQKDQQSLSDFSDGFAVDLHARFQNPLY